VVLGNGPRPGEVVGLPWEKGVLRRSSGEEAHTGKEGGGLDLTVAAAGAW